MMLHGKKKDGCEIYIMFGLLVSQKKIGSVKSHFMVLHSK
jgi:hypothetical protein